MYNSVYLLCNKDKIRTIYKKIMIILMKKQFESH